MKETWMSSSGWDNGLRSWEGMYSTADSAGGASSMEVKDVAIVESWECRKLGVGIVKGDLVRWIMVENGGGIEAVSFFLSLSS